LPEAMHKYADILDKQAARFRTMPDALEEEPGN
jgi:hypothetical protein